MAPISISRRQLLKGAGALIVSFSMPGPALRALAQTDAGGGRPEATSLDSWIAIGQDETVTVFTSKVELGTGTETALAQIVAEELDVEFGRIRMEAGDTDKTVDQAATVGSRTLERAGPQLRQAAAVARQELLKLASERLQTPVDQLGVAGGVVSAMNDPSKRISYGTLIGNRRFNVRIAATGTGWDMKVAPEARAKDPKTYRIVGTSVPRTDLPGKFTGEFTYVQDVRVPGMLHGRVVRPPVVNSAPMSIDESSIREIAGATVVREGAFVGVVAETEWAAIRAAKALKVTWSAPATKMPGGADEIYAYLKDTKSYQDQVPADRGDVDAAMSRAAKTFEATYKWPFQIHGMLGPSCAVADVRPDRATIWAGSQGPFRTRDRIAAILKLPADSVRVIYREASGCYGRLSADDVAEDAVVMSRAAGKPVRVQWTRGDEHAWAPKGPPHLITVRAGVDADGGITGWNYVDRSFPWTETQGMPLLASRQLGMKPSGQGSSNGQGGGGQAYSFENAKVVAALVPWVQQEATPLRTSNLRAPGDLARHFASECFIDEIAADLRVDPVEFRLRYLERDKRGTEALVAATTKAGWKARASPLPAARGPKAIGRGVALATRSGTVTCAVADIEVDRPSGKVVVKRITLSHDCGLIVNPDGVRNQIEGNLLQGVSRTLLEEVQFDATGIKSLDWQSYPIITFDEVPEVEIVLINRPEMAAFGAGEPSISPVPAAVANAIFDAIGVRLREIPLTPERVRAAMAVGGRR